MPIARLTFQSSTSGFVNVTGSLTVTGDHGEAAAPASLPAAKAGALTTRASDTAGTLTMDSESHGIIEGDRIDIYHAGGVSYGAAVGEVVTTSVPFTGAAGAVLPLDESEIVAAVAQSVAFSVIVADLAAMVANQENNSRTHYVFVGADAEDSPTATDILVAAGGEFHWDGTGTDPFAGDSAVTISSVWISHEDTTAAHTGTIAAAITD